jgi:hypothetical protein
MYGYNIYTNACILHTHIYLYICTENLYLYTQIYAYYIYIYIPKLLWANSNPNMSQIYSQIEPLSTDQQVKLHKYMYKYEKKSINVCIYKYIQILIFIHILV